MFDPNTLVLEPKKTSAPLGTVDLRECEFEWPSIVRIGAQLENITAIELRDQLRSIGECSFVGMVTDSQGSSQFRDLIHTNISVQSEAPELHRRNRLRGLLAPLLGTKDSSTFRIHTSNTVTSVAIALNKAGRVSLSTSPETTLGYGIRV